MIFAAPHFFWLLLLPLGLLAWEIALRSRAAVAGHPKILQAEAGANSLRLKGKAEPTRPQNRPRVWLCVGLVLAIVGLARPQWGRIDEPVFDQAREIVIAVDLSRSMLTPDVRPSRLDRSKLLIQSLLEKLAGERVGLVSFAGTAFVQSPLSSDYEILREFLPSLGPDFLPEGGTNYRALIDTSLSAFGTSDADRFLIILSDGGATDEDWKSEAELLKKKGIRVIALGIGTAAGAMIPNGSGGFVKDERGAVVLSKLEPGPLQELAQMTGGTYRDASSWIDLAGVLQSTVDAGKKGMFRDQTSVRLVERFQWPLAFGLWCLMMSFCYEFPVQPRPRAITLPAETPSSAPAAPPVIATLLVIGLLAAGLGLPATARAEDNRAAILAKIVARLSAKPDCTARDWAELARETVTWGQHLQDDQRPVPESPVRDALAAVDLGSALNAHTADWPKLRADLEALLRKPEPQKKDQQQQQNQQQKQQDQKQQSDQQKQNQDQSQSNQSKQDNPSQGKSPEQPKQQQPNSQEGRKDSPQDSKPGQSAFGDMQKREQPVSPHDTQKVGGVPEKKEGEATPSDPTLALPLQKLDQLRNQDSPAELFQLMDSDHKQTAPKKHGKDW